MKNVLIIAVLMFAFGNAFAGATLAITLSPIASATKIILAASVTSLAPFASTFVVAQSRGVAGREQIKDELVALNDDMVSGAVKTINEVRQPALKELFAEIAANDAQMREISSAVKEGSKLHRIATAVTVALFAE